MRARIATASTVARGGRGDGMLGLFGAAFILLLGVGPVLGPLYALRGSSRGHLWFAALLGGVVLAFAVFMASGLRFVLTPSVPLGLYKTRPYQGQSLSVGQYVCVQTRGANAPEGLRRAFADGTLPADWRNRDLLKRVVAGAGSVVEYANDAVTVDGAALPSSRHLDKDRDGRALPTPPYPVVLGEAQVWVSSEHPRGFDSRYFGPVEKSAISCVGDLLWTM